MADDPSTAPADRDLAGRAMGAIDLLVDTLHDKVVRPILLIGRTVAFAFIIVVCVGVICVGLCVALLRLLDVYAFAAHQWASWALLGALFVTVGLVVWRYRKTPARSGQREVTERRKLAIIGSGPAGLTAAIYAARAQLDPVVIEGEPSSTSDQPGGQLMLTTEVENYPGFIDAIMGPDLMGAMRAQAARFGADLRVAKVTRADLSASPFSLWLGDHDEPDLVCDAVILASGARAVPLSVPGEARLLGYGLSTCATCDGFFFRGQEIAVVGGGDSALEEALFLTRFATKVTVVHRRDELRASRIMQTRAFEHDKIEFRWNTVVTEVLGEDRLTGLAVRDTVTGEASTMALGGVFVAIGHEPNTSLVKGQLDLDEGGYVRTTTGTATSVDGVFAAGDVQDHVYRQAVTSAGSGCMAAIDAERWLEHRGH